MAISTMTHPVRPGSLARIVAGLAVVGFASSTGSSCGEESDSAPSPTSVDPFVARDGRLYDADGREVLLRGVNARVEGLFDVTFDDGRIALEDIPAFGGEDCRFLAEELGMNHLRLPVNWSAIEPERGQYDEGYLARIVDLVTACHQHGVATLVDLHQDAYSKEIGEDGAPLWAIVPPPEKLLEGPLTDLEARRTSPQVLAAFASLYDDAEGLRAAYAEMAAWLAVGIEGVPGVVGLELMNEPVELVFEERIDDFHDVVGAAVRAAAPTLTIFFEPNSTRNLTDDAPVRRPIGLSDAVYGPHIYVDVFEDGWESEDVSAIESSVGRAKQEADDHAASLYVGEFGAAPDERGQRYVTSCYDLFDRNVASAALWLYEESSQGAWGLYDSSEEQGRIALREEVARNAARPFPAAVAGSIESFSYDPETRVLSVSLARASDEQRHVLSAPKLTYPTGVRVSCDGVEVEATPSPGRVTVSCAGRLLELAPRE
jgi:endoglycosylceramidase